jgi:hypothetical protein
MVTEMKERRTGGRPKRAKENGGEEAVQPISYKPSRDVAAAIEEFRAKFPDFPPGRTKIIDRALRSFLSGQGISISLRPDED